MTTAAPRPIEARLIELFDHLGLSAAHVAGGRLALADWQGLAARHPERLASLTLVSPPLLDPAGLAGLAARLFAVAGDTGPTARGAAQLLADLPAATAHILHGYECHPWSDVMAERGSEIGPAMLEFLDRHPAPAVALPEAEGAVAEISYHIRGAGPPLVLLPLDLVPAQWEPLIPTLAARYCTISLGGPLLGAVGILEERGRSNYLDVVRAILELARIRPGETVLEVGGGSGVVLRELARRTAGANPIVDVDINPYLLREAEALAKRAGLAERLSFREGSAEAIPLADASVDVALAFTVMEEGDAARMLAELVRVTRPGGRVAAIVRAVDMPSWAGLQLSPAVRAKVDKPGLLGAGFAAAGCADASLYRRFAEAGLTQLTCFPQYATVTPVETSRMTMFQQQILATLTPAEAGEWHAAATRSMAEGTFHIATGYHCAVGTKPG